LADSQDRNPLRLNQT